MADPEASNVRQLDGKVYRTGRGKRKRGGYCKRAVEALIDCRTPTETDRRVGPRRECCPRRSAEAPAFAVHNEAGERGHSLCLMNGEILKLRADADADPIVDAICDGGIRVV